MSSQRERDRARSDNAADLDTARAGGSVQEAAAPAITVEGLRKQFGDGADAVTAVDDISFRVEPGSVVGLLGPNGAGKTTTIKCLLGMIVPDAGSVSVAGVDVLANPRAAYRHVDAMLEGARNDYWRLTVRENLRYFATIGGVKPDDVAGRHDTLLDQLDLAAEADTAVRDLSRGMKQKVSLASVLATDADVVFLDEPTLGLDVESSLTLRRELRRIVGERGLTALVTSHDMDVIEDVCDRVIIVNDGRVVADDAVDSLLGGLDAQGIRVASPDLEGAPLRAVRDQFEVRAVRHQGNHTSVEVTTGSDGFYELVALLRAHDVTVSSVDTIESDLESAFLEVTRE